MNIIIYALCYPDGTPFYIGQTRHLKQRLSNHLTLRKKKGNKNDIIRALYEQSERPIMHFLELTDERDAENREAWWIKRFPNVTNVRHGKATQLKRYYEWYCPDCESITAENWTQRCKRWQCGSFNRILQRVYVVNPDTHEQWDLGDDVIERTYRLNMEYKENWGIPVHMLWRDNLGKGWQELKDQSKIGVWRLA